MRLFYTENFWGRRELGSVKRWYHLIISAMFYGYSNPLLVHFRLKHRGNVFSFFFSVRMEEKITLQGRCCAQA